MEAFFPLSPPSVKARSLCSLNSFFRPDLGRELANSASFHPSPLSALLNELQLIPARVLQLSLDKLLSCAQAPSLLSLHLPHTATPCRWSESTV